MVVALFFMMLLAFIGTALIGLLPVEFRSSSRNQLDVQGHYAASAGIRYANTWFTSVITPWDPTLPEYYKEADTAGANGVSVTWGNAPYGPSYDIMGVPSNHLDWERLKLKDLQFPKSGTYIAPEHISGWSTPPKGNVLCGYSGASAPDEDATDVIATKRPLKMGDDWTVWVAFVPNNNQDTPGSQLGGLNSNFISKPRSYQMISVAFYQGQPYLRAKAVIKEASTAKFARLIGDLAPPDNSAAGIGISGSEWMMGANQADQTLYNGPVHSNKYLPMSIGANVWGTTSTNKTFTGVLSYVSAAPTVGGWNKDDVLWAGGNYNAFDADRRPFQSDTDGSAVPTGNAANPDRYSALIKNGKSNLQKVKAVPFPQSSAKLYDLAFGTASNQVSSVYTNTAKIPDGTFGKILDSGGNPIMVNGVDANGNIIQVPKKPNGLFINYDGNGALGGVYINGDVKAAILEAVDSGNNPITSTSALASTQYSTTSTMNQAIRIQDEQLSTREVVATVITTSSSKTVATTKTTTYVTGVQPVTSSNAVATSTVRTTSSVPSTITSTVQVPTTTYSSCTNRSTATQTNVPVGTTTNRTTSSTYVSNANGSGSAGWQLATATTKTTQLGNTTQVTSSTVRCGTTTQNVGSQQTSNGPNVQVVATTYPVSYGAPITSTTFSTNANVATSKATTWTTVTQASPVTQYETWHAMDQAIITNGASSQSVTIPATLDMTGAVYKTPAGASGAFTFDNSKTGNLLDLTTGTRKPMTVLDQNGNPIGAGGQTVGPTEMAVLKQSRTDPSQVYLFIVPKKIATSGPDNGKPINGGTGNSGVFYADGNINGLGGVNVGKKTIAAQNNALGAKEISIADNVLTLGTAAKTQPNIHTNGLGLIAENVNIVARNDRFNSNQTSDPLLIYAIVMAGKNTSDGGMRVKRAKAPQENYLAANSLPGQIVNDHFMTSAEFANYQSNLNNGVNDYNTPFDMNYLTGTYKTGAGIGSNTPLFKMYGGLLEKVPRIIYITGLNTAGWQSSFSYDQLLANDPPPGWPTQGKPEVISYQEERL